MIKITISAQSSNEIIRGINLALLPKWDIMEVCAFVSCKVPRYLMNSSMTTRLFVLAQLDYYLSRGAPRAEGADCLVLNLATGFAAYSNYLD